MEPQTCDRRLRASDTLGDSPDADCAGALRFLILLFTRSLFRGNLLDGHDSLAYPPRLTESPKILSDHQFPPVWAPDSRQSGMGNRCFEFRTAADLRDGIAFLQSRPHAG